MYSPEAEKTTNLLAGLVEHFTDKMSGVSTRKGLGKHLSLTLFRVETLRRNWLDIAEHLNAVGDLLNLACPLWIITEAVAHVTGAHLADDNNDDDGGEDAGGASGSETDSDLDLEEDPEDSAAGGAGAGKSGSNRKPCIACGKRPNNHFYSHLKALDKAYHIAYEARLV